MSIVYDLVQRKGEKIAIVANIFAGRRKSLHKDIPKLLRVEKPDILILIDMLDLHHGTPEPREVYQLVKTIDDIRPRVRIVYGCSELSHELYKRPEIMEYSDEEVRNKLMEKLEEKIDSLSANIPDDLYIDEDAYLAALMKLRLLYRFSSKEHIRVKLSNDEELSVISGDRLALTFSEELREFKTPSMERILGELETIRNKFGADWLVSGHPGIARIYYDSRIVFPGSWHIYSEDIIFSKYTKPTHLEKYLTIEGDCQFTIKGIDYTPSVKRLGHRPTTYRTP